MKPVVQVFLVAALVCMSVMFGCDQDDPQTKQRKALIKQLEERFARMDDYLKEIEAVIEKKEQELAGKSWWPGLKESIRRKVASAREGVSSRRMNRLEALDFSNYLSGYSSDPVAAKLNTELSRYTVRYDYEILQIGKTQQDLDRLGN